MDEDVGSVGAAPSGGASAGGALSTHAARSQVSTAVDSGVAGRAIDPSRSVDEDSALSAADGNETPSNSQHTASHHPANSLASTAMAPRQAGRDQHATSPKVPTRTASGVSKTRQRAPRGGTGEAGRFPRGGTPVSTYGQLTFPDTAPDITGNEAHPDQNEGTGLAMWENAFHGLPAAHQQQNLQGVGLMLPGPSAASSLHHQQGVAVAPHAAFHTYANNLGGMLQTTPLLNGLIGNQLGILPSSGSNIAASAAATGMQAGFIPLGLGVVWPPQPHHGSHQHNLSSTQQQVLTSHNLSAMAVASGPAMAAPAYSNNHLLSSMLPPFLVQQQPQQLQNLLQLQASALQPQTHQQPPATGPNHMNSGPSLLHGHGNHGEGQTQAHMLQPHAPLIPHSIGHPAVSLSHHHHHHHHDQQQQQQQQVIGLTGSSPGAKPLSLTGDASACSGGAFAGPVAGRVVHPSTGPPHASSLNVLNSSLAAVTDGHVIQLQQMPSGAMPQIAALHSAQGAVAAAQQGDSTGRRPLLRDHSCGDFDTGATHGETSSHPQQPHGSGTGRRALAGHDRAKEGGVEACSGAEGIPPVLDGVGAFAAGNSAHNALVAGGLAAPHVNLAAHQTHQIPTSPFQVPAPSYHASPVALHPSSHQAPGLVLHLGNGTAIPSHTTQHPFAAHLSLTTPQHTAHYPILNNPAPPQQQQPHGVLPHHPSQQHQLHSPACQTPNVYINQDNAPPSAHEGHNHMLVSPQSTSPQARPLQQQQLLLPMASRCNSLAPAGFSPSDHPHGSAPHGNSVAPHQSLLQPIFAAAGAGFPLGNIQQQQQQDMQEAAHQLPHLVLSSPPPVFALNLALVSGGTATAATAVPVAPFHSTAVPPLLNVLHSSPPHHQQQLHQPQQQAHQQQAVNRNQPASGISGAKQVGAGRKAPASQMAQSNIGSPSGDCRTMDTTNSGPADGEGDGGMPHGVATMADSQIGLIGQPRTVGDSACSSSSVSEGGHDTSEAADSRMGSGVAASNRRARAEVSSSFPPAWRGSVAGGGCGGTAEDGVQADEVEQEEGEGEMGEGAGAMDWQAHQQAPHANLAAASHASMPHVLENGDGTSTMRAAHSAAAPLQAPLGAPDAQAGPDQMESEAQPNTSNKRLLEGTNGSEAAASGPVPATQRQSRHGPRKSARLGPANGANTASTCTTKQQPQPQHAQASSPNQHYTAHQTESDNSTLHGSQLLQQRAEQQQLLSSILLAQQLLQQQQQEQQQLSSHGGNVLGAVSQAGSADDGGGYACSTGPGVTAGHVTGAGEGAALQQEISLHAAESSLHATPLVPGIFRSHTGLLAAATAGAAAALQGQIASTGPSSLRPQGSISSKAAQNLPSGVNTQHAQNGGMAPPTLNNNVYDATTAAQYSSIQHQQSVLASTAAAFAEFAAAMGSVAPMGGSASQVDIAHSHLYTASTRAAGGSNAAGMHTNRAGNLRENLGSRLAAAMAEGAGQTFADDALGGDRSAWQRAPASRRFAPAPVVPDPRVTSGGALGRGRGIGSPNGLTPRAAASSRGAVPAPALHAQHQLHTPHTHPHQQHHHHQQQHHPSGAGATHAVPHNTAPLQPPQWNSGSAQAAPAAHSHHHFSPPEPSHNNTHSDIGSTHRGAAPQRHAPSRGGHTGGNMSPPHNHHYHHHSHHQQQHQQQLQSGSHHPVAEPPAQSASNQTQPDAAPNGDCSSHGDTAQASGLAMSEAHATAHGAMMGPHGWGDTSGGPQDGEVQQPDQAGDSNGFLTVLEPEVTQSQLMDPPILPPSYQQRQPPSRAQQQGQQQQHPHHHHHTQVHPQHTTQTQHVTHAQHPPAHQQHQNNDTDHSAAGSPPAHDEFQQHESHSLGPVVASYYQQYLHHQTSNPQPAGHVAAPFPNPALQQQQWQQQHNPSHAQHPSHPQSHGPHGVHHHHHQPQPGGGGFLSLAPALPQLQPTASGGGQFFPPGNALPHGHEQQIDQEVGSTGLEGGEGMGGRSAKRQSHHHSTAAWQPHQQHPQHHIMQEPAMHAHAAPQGVGSGDAAVQQAGGGGRGNGGASTAEDRRRNTRQTREKRRRSGGSEHTPREGPTASGEASRQDDDDDDA